LYYFIQILVIIRDKKKEGRRKKKIMDTQQQARALMMRHHQMVKNRQQSLLNRVASEIGLDTNGLDYSNGTQGKPNSSYLQFLFFLWFLVTFNLSNGVFFD
jgi:phosphopantetheinyl transferase